MYSGYRRSLGSMGMGKEGGCSIMSLSTLKLHSWEEEIHLILDSFWLVKNILFLWINKVLWKQSSQNRTVYEILLYAGHRGWWGRSYGSTSGFFFSHSRQFLIMETFLFSKAQCFHSYCVLFLTSFQIRGFSCGAGEHPNPWQRVLEDTLRQKYFGS